MKKFKSRYITYSIALILLLLHYSNVLPDTDKKYSREEYPLVVKYLDVGQGDSELILLPNNETILIDAGEKEYSDTIIDELNDLNIQKIDYLIATHPHSDHIGGMKNILDTFDVESIYMPRTTHTSTTYLSLLEKISENNMKINSAKANLQLINDNDLNVSFVSPASEYYEDINNYSAVLKVEYKNTSFLFTGDIEELAEYEIIKNKYDVSADVLKVAHHGSSTSTSKAFLKQVNPRYAVISCGTDNDYGHPHRETMEKLNDMTVFRTDKMGTITMYSNGEEIKTEIARGILP